nr:LOW QUALITY PROTEIN: interferon-induced very large GTPase 1-like [Salvelinus alpinus]
MGCAEADKQDNHRKIKASEREIMENKHCKGAEIDVLLSRLNLKGKYQDKFTLADFLIVGPSSPQQLEPRSEEELAPIFLQRLFAMDYTARYIVVKEETSKVDNSNDGNDPDNTDIEEESTFDDFYSEKGNISDGIKKQHIHPMDVQMAMFHCSDSFLKQYMVTKLSLCQYALPLLVPNPLTKEIECPLWAFRQIKKKWKSTTGSDMITSRNMHICQADNPIVSFFRLGSVSSSKSQLLSNMINQRYNTFFHRNCPGSILMDGVVEIAWYCPAGKANDNFTDCVAFCNLHGDAEAFERQRKILIELPLSTLFFYQVSEKVEKVKQLCRSSSSLPNLSYVFSLKILLLHGMKGKGNYKMGLKGRNQSDVVEELKNIIRETLSESSCTFRLEDMIKHPGVKVDENQGDCQKAKYAALQIKDLLGMDLSTMKDKFLPYQGRQWHDWCQKNKDLYRLRENLRGKLEIEKSDIQMKMTKIRSKQRDTAVSEPMELFISHLRSMTGKDQIFFLKWVEIVMDDLSSGMLSDIHQKYDEKWSDVLALKKRHDKSDQLKKKQMELEGLSEKLQAATLGLEHVLREMGQIYEAHASCLGVSNFSYLPEMAAELMISGHPMELMDGDAAHVPLTWINAVLDEVIKKLGDQRVFVLSVLGIQSTGKSTMLNAMFGLQFAVSAGRCTRGAFMQLVKVSKYMKENLDYVLVIDTEGLRALELVGKATLHHDNELATFVIGLGNMTLINIFGENPAEMQDIIQIAVQAFMRMKQVSLTPSCVFVHQNVGDIAAGEKNMEGKRRLQDKLDEMTQLAAKEEVCNAECFSDVIAFDIQRDVKYFSQLWEGSPPMAPPNPCYSENVQELKRIIFSKTSKSNGMRLSQFKSSIQDLWNALLNEKFVFSFKNTHEIAVHRKLEVEYEKWTWDLRSAMLTIENTLRNRIENTKLNQVEEKDIVAGMEDKRKELYKAIEKYFDEDKDREILIQWKGKFECNIKGLIENLVKETTRKLMEVIQQKEALKKLGEKSTLYEDELFKKSKNLALDLKHKIKDENELTTEFDSVWKNWVSELTKNTSPIQDIDMSREVPKILTEIYEFSFVHDRRDCGEFTNISLLGDYSNYLKITKLWNVFDKVVRQYILTPEDHKDVRGLVQRIITQTEHIIGSKPIARMGYSNTYMQEIARHVKEQVMEFQSRVKKYVFKKEFIVDLSLFVCERSATTFTQLHREFRNANDALVHLQGRKPQYYNVFKNYLQGATSTAVIGDFICSKLKPSIKQAIYDQAAIDLAGEMRVGLPAFKGNRSNLEKHILNSLAAEDSFDKFITYIYEPRQHFEGFISDTVEKYISTQNNPRVVNMIRENIKHKEQCVILAMQSATEEVKECNGDIQMWLKHVSNKITDELEFSDNYPNGVVSEEITGFDFLEEVVKKGLTTVIEELRESLSSSTLLKMELFREKPDEILIKHLCNCCWETCPFCGAICTNTIAGHSTDHSVPFHRTKGVNGWYYRGTEDIVVDFCTTLVASDRSFHPKADSEDTTLYKNYKTAGPKYADWSITPDLSTLPYWKWFVFRFQSDLEKHYNKKFQGYGKIPSDWQTYTQKQAIDSLAEYI